MISYYDHTLRKFRLPSDIFFETTLNVSDENFYNEIIQLSWLVLLQNANFHRHNATMR